MSEWIDILIAVGFVAAVIACAGLLVRSDRHENRITQVEGQLSFTIDQLVERFLSLEHYLGVEYRYRTKTESHHVKVPKERSKKSG